ncbi:MAG: 2-enoyl thioester reductase domain-containing protein [Chthoniobacterales bacterium]|nr:2-enoyl thioester reductase domain-containing protein [Chthoniobacterales bacterium]
MSRAARLKQFGKPAESLVLEDFPLPSPGPEEVLLDMVAAPVNPADLNVIEGTYGDLPELPATIGNEGVGRIVAVGLGVTGCSPGQLVLPMTFGTWCSQMLVPARHLIPLPDGLDTNQAAMLTVNPATAWRMLQDFVHLAPGDWIVQNAANSGVGRSVIQIARALGWKTLNVVRRPELVGELTDAGGTIVVTEEYDLRKELKTLCGGARPKLALNAVGGPSALNIANALAPGGTMVTFGAMSKQPLKIPNGLLIFKGLKFGGFWLNRWRKTADRTTLTETYAALARLLREGNLFTPLHVIHPLTQVVEAVGAAGREKRAGKVLLDLSR